MYSFFDKAVAPHFYVRRETGTNENRAYVRVTKTHVLDLFNSGLLVKSHIKHQTGKGDGECTGVR